MKFFSTRGSDVARSASEAIAKGLADDGGLFVPEFFPNFTNKLDLMLNMSYAERACEVIHSFLYEYDKQDLLNACENAYASFEEGLSPASRNSHTVEGATIYAKSAWDTYVPTSYSTLLFSRSVTLCDPMDCSTSGFSILHHLPEFAQIHVS